MTSMREPAAFVSACSQQGDAGHVDAVGSQALDREGAALVESQAGQGPHLVRSLLLLLLHSLALLSQLLRFATSFLSSMSASSFQAV